MLQHGTQDGNFYLELYRVREETEELYLELLVFTVVERVGWERGGGWDLVLFSPPYCEG